jgi:hypothetical protein
MAQTNFTPISLYYSTTAAAVPVNTNLVSGELAINITDGKLYYKNNGGTVTLLASTAGASGDVVGPASATDNALARFDATTGKLIQNSVGILSDAGILTGLTGITSSGSITFSSLTSGRVTYAGTSGLLQDSSNLTFDGTTLGVSSGSSTPALKLYGAGNAQGQLQFGSTAGYVIQGGPDYTGLVYNVGSASYQHIFQINSSEQMRLTSTGLGIGTSSPAYSLEVSKSQDAVTNIAVTNASSGTAAQTRLRLNNGGSNFGTISHTGASFTTSGIFRADGTYVFGNGTGGLTLTTGAVQPIYFAIDNSEKMRLDASGNLGLGVTPSAWGTTRALQFPGGSIGGFTNGTDNNQSIMLGNSYFGSGGGVYINSDYATYYRQYSGTHAWFNAPSGTAGNAITFTQAMTLDASGNLGIGTSSPAALLHLSSGNGTKAIWGTTRNFTVNRNWQVAVDEYAEGQFTITPSTTLGGTTFTTPAVRIDSSGNLGLGVTPSAWGGSNRSVMQFPGSNAIQGSGSLGLALFNNAYNNGTNDIYSANGAAYKHIIGTAFQWFTAPSGTAGNAITFTQAMTLDASGNLLVGTTSTGLQTARSMSFLVSGGGFQTINHSTSDGSGDLYVQFGYNGTKIGSITQNGTTGVLYNTTSDYRLKTVIGPVANAGQRIDALKPVEYKWKSDNSSARGFLAHEFQEVYPNSVTGTKDSVDADGNPVYQNMQASTSEVIADLVTEIQSLRIRIAQLENKL